MQGVLRDHSLSHGYSPTNRPFYLPRLPPEYYRGDAVVHWTFTIVRRGQGWLNDQFHVRFRELMLHALAREHLMCPGYCLMPDHQHFIWMGLSLQSDQRNGIAFVRTYLEPALDPHRYQHQPHDHVVRERERHRNAFAAVCQYILDNPRRAGLVEDPRNWRYHGAIVPGYPTLHPLQPEFWFRFWKLYSEARQPDAGNLVRPPIPRHPR